MTVEPTPADATVTLVAQGETQVGNTIEVEANAKVQYTVSKAGYTTKSGEIMVNEDDLHLAVELVPKVTLTIEATPDTASVVLTDMDDPTCIQGITDIAVNKGDRVNINVAAGGYVTHSETVTVTEDTTKEITLEPEPEP